VKPLHNAIPFTTQKDNRYLCSRGKRQVLLCHPILYHILLLYEQGVDIEKWISSLPAGGIKIANAGVFTKKKVAYYVKKYRFLQKHGYLGAYDFDRRISRDLKPETIHQTLANVREVVFEVTDACNLKCKYCGYGKFYQNYDTRRNAKLDFQTAKRLLIFLQKLWNSDLNTSVDSRIAIGFYGGEPLLNFPLIQKMVTFIKQMDLHRHHIVFTMTTNGLRLSKHMDYLHDNQFELLISLDGNPGNNIYRVLPDGREAYERILKNITLLRAKYPDYFRKRVNFNVVFHDKSSLDEIYAYFKVTFNKIPMISELNVAGIDPARADEFWKTFASVSDDLERIGSPDTMITDMFIDLPNINSLSKFIHHYTHCSYTDYNDVMAADNEARRLLTGTCIPFLRKIFLTVNHKILPCERIGQQYAVGRVAKDRVEIDVNGIAEIYNQYYRRITDRCRACFNADNCGQCLFYLDLEKSHPACERFMSNDQRRDRFAAHLGYLEDHPRTYARIIKEVIYD
jgi:uncharacterized protein